MTLYFKKRARAPPSTLSAYITEHLSCEENALFDSRFFKALYSDPSVKSIPADLIDNKLQLSSSRIFVNYSLNDVIEKCRTTPKFAPILSPVLHKIMKLCKKFDAEMLALTQKNIKQIIEASYSQKICLDHSNELLSKEKLKSSQLQEQLKLAPQLRMRLSVIPCHRGGPESFITGPWNIILMPVEKDDDSLSVYQQIINEKDVQTIKHILQDALAKYSVTFEHNVSKKILHGFNIEIVLLRKIIVRVLNFLKEIKDITCDVFDEVK